MGDRRIRTGKILILALGATQFIGQVAKTGLFFRCAEIIDFNRGEGLGRQNQAQQGSGLAQYSGLT
jgi:hypothetical protein